jgi:hypothetical protein
MKEQIFIIKDYKKGRLPDRNHRILPTARRNLKIAYQQRSEIARPTRVGQAFFKN